MLRPGRPWRIRPPASSVHPVRITLNGDPYELGEPTTISRLLARLDIDPRRVAVEHNLVVVKRSAYASTTVQAEDTVEIVNFVGGGQGSSP